MRFEEIISSAVMCLVSGLVLIGFTIAWYTNNNMPAVTGLEMTAAQTASVKVEVTANINELMPGSTGAVTLKVTPIGGAKSCDIVPSLQLIQEGSSNESAVVVEVNGEEPDTEETDGGEADNGSGAATTPTPAELEEIAQSHIQFFRDEAMTNAISSGDSIRLDWTDGSTEVKTKVVYWKWHYENPTSDDDAAKKTYDVEDMTLGDNISHMKFYFNFTVQ